MRSFRDDVGVRAVERRARTFHARFDATWRQYRYMIGEESHQPLGRQYAWFRTGPKLDVDAMRDAASLFPGKRDCGSLAGGGKGVPWSPVRDTDRGTIRTIFDVTVNRVEPWWAPGEIGTAVVIQVAADGVSAADGAQHRGDTRAGWPRQAKP